MTVFIAPRQLMSVAMTISYEPRITRPLAPGNRVNRTKPRKSCAISCVRLAYSSEELTGKVSSALHRLRHIGQVFADHRHRVKTPHNRVTMQQTARLRVPAAIVRAVWRSQRCPAGQDDCPGFHAGQ